MNVSGFEGNQRGRVAASRAVASAVKRRSQSPVRQRPASTTTTSTASMANRASHTPASTPPASKEGFVASAITWVKNYIDGVAKEWQKQRNEYVKQNMPLFTAYSEEDRGRMLDSEEAAVIKGLEGDRDYTRQDVNALKSLLKKYDAELLAKRKEGLDQLNRLWPNDKSHDHLLKTAAGLQLIQDNANIVDRKERWGDLETQNDHFGQKTIGFHVEKQYYFFDKIVKEDGKTNKSVLNLLVQKGLISQSDVGLLVKFANKELLTQKEIARLVSVQNNVLSPLAYASHKETNAKIKEVASPKEKMFCLRLKKNPFEITSSGLARMKSIAVKYLGPNNLHPRKKEAIARYKKLFVDNITEWEHRILETEKGQKELIEKEKIYDREGEWKTLEDELNAIRELRGNFFTYLAGKQVLTKKQEELVKKFLDPKRAVHFNESDRQEVRRVTEKVIKPISFVVREKAEGAEYKSTAEKVMKQWINAVELIALRDDFTALPGQAQVATGPAPRRRASVTTPPEPAPAPPTAAPPPPAAAPLSPAPPPVVEPSSPTAGPEASSPGGEGRSALLAGIRGGTKLKKVEAPKGDKPASAPTGLMGDVAKVLGARRVGIDGGNDNPDSDDEWED